MIKQFLTVIARFFLARRLFVLMVLPFLLLNYAFAEVIGTRNNPALRRYQELALQDEIQKLRRGKTILLMTAEALKIQIFISSPVQPKKKDTH